MVYGYDCASIFEMDEYVALLAICTWRDPVIIMCCWRMRFGIKDYACVWRRYGWNRLRLRVTFDDLYDGWLVYRTLLYCILSIRVRPALTKEQVFQKLGNVLIHFKNRRAVIPINQNSLFRWLVLRYCCYLHVQSRLPKCRFGLL